MRKTTLTLTLKVTLLFLTMFLMGTAYIHAEDGTIIFGTENVTIDSENVSADDNLGNTWTINTVIATPSFTQKPTYSQVGSAKKPATSITFTTIRRLPAPMDRAASITPASTSFSEDSTIRAIKGIAAMVSGTMVAVVP